MARKHNKKFSELNPNYKKDYYDKNKLILLPKNRATYYKNWDQHRKIKQEWKSKNKHATRMHSSFRRDMIRRSRPLKNFHYEELFKIYSSVPVNMEVDHIIPIVHDKVCGLHVPYNLQYLDKISNRSKGNKFDGTYDNTSWIL